MKIPERHQKEIQTLMRLASDKGHIELDGIAKKYENVRIVAEEDDTALILLAGIGLVKLGFNFEKMEPTAGLTEMGKDIMLAERQPSS